MKILIYLFVILAAVIVLTLFAFEDTGYVLISRAPWEMEISLSLFVLLIFLAFIALYVVLRFTNRVVKAPRDVGKWRDQQRVNKAQLETMQGYAQLIEGDWAKAEKFLTRRVDHTPTPLLNYLGASYAAQQQGDTGKRDAYLKQAHDVDPRSRVAVQLTHARMQYQNGQLQEALATLQKLRATAPRNGPVVRLLTDVVRSLGDWEQVTQLLPAARKTSAYTEKELGERESEAVQEILSAAARDSAGKERLTVAWKSLSRKQRKDVRFIEIYARQLIEIEDMDRAEQILRAAIKSEWRSKLVYLYGLVKSSRFNDQFKIAESWLKTHPSDPDLMLTLGRLAVQNKLWGKATSYFETAIAENESEEAYSELGNLLELLGEHDKAREVYRRGLQFHGLDTQAGLPKPISTQISPEQPLDGVVQPRASEP